MRLETVTTAASLRTSYRTGGIVSLVLDLPLTVQGVKRKKLILNKNNMKICEMLHKNKNFKFKCELT